MYTVMYKLFISEIKKYEREKKDLANEKDKQEMIGYLEEYFALARDYDRIGPMLKRTCR